MQDQCSIHCKALSIPWDYVRWVLTLQMGVEGGLVLLSCAGGSDGPSGELVGEEELVGEWLSVESSSGQDSSTSLSEVTLLSRDIVGREVWRGLVARMSSSTTMGTFSIKRRPPALLQPDGSLMGDVLEPVVSSGQLCNKPA